MPPSKKQKTSADSSAPTQAPEPENATPHKNDEPKLREEKSIPLYEYVCMHRPHFDYVSENHALGENGLEGAELFEKYQKDYEEAAKGGVILEPAKDHPDWKWTILWEGYKTFSDYQRRAKYCDPDNFSMHIYNDFQGYGLQELMENMLLAFDTSLKKKDDDNLKRMWATISSLALWLNEVDMYPFVSNDDGAKVKALRGLMGYALLRALAALDHAEEMKPDTEFLDVSTVITSFLKWSSDLPECDIEDEAVEWCEHAAAYLKKSKLEASKGVTGTEKLLEDIEASDEKKLPKKSVKDPWGWAKRLKEYKSLYGNPKIGGTQYDITKMTRKERARYAFDNEDPLQDVSEKDLKEGNLDFA